MAQISDVRLLLFAALETYADANSLRIEVKGEGFKPGDDETYLRFHFRTAEPSKPYAGYKALDKEHGFLQVDVFGPESRKQVAFEKIASEIREVYWPSNSVNTPTLGSDPLVRIGPAAPHVKDHPAPDVGRLGSTCTVWWESDFPKT